MLYEAHTHHTLLRHPDTSPSLLSTAAAWSMASQVRLAIRVCCVVHDRLPSLGPLEKAPFDLVSHRSLDLGTCVQLDQHGGMVLVGNGQPEVVLYSPCIPYLCWKEV